MNKTELVAEISKTADITQAQAGAALSAFINIVGDELKNGGRVQLMGFGTFETRTRAARDGVNPKTGEAMKIAETVVPAFKAGAQLKSTVRS